MSADGSLKQPPFRDCWFVWPQHASVFPPITIPLIYVYVGAYIYVCTFSHCRRQSRTARVQGSGCKVHSGGDNSSCSPPWPNWRGSYVGLDVHCKENTLHDPTTLALSFFEFVYIHVRNLVCFTHVFPYWINTPVVSLVLSLKSPVELWFVRVNWTPLAELPQ